MSTAPRHIWILGNWKQHHLRTQAATCAAAISAGLPDALRGTTGISAGIAPPYLSLDAAAAHTAVGGLQLLAQDVAAQNTGAHTGEIGPRMLRETGVTGAIIGHSECRARMKDPADVARKVNAALAADLRVILCVGESLDARNRGDHERLVISQLCEAMPNVSQEPPLDRLVIAYEPVWAIGTGKTATPEQANAMHACIRAWMADRHGAASADRSVIYGGSVKPDNASTLIAQPDIDGFLIGGASLDAASFLAIVAAAATPAPA